MILPSDAVTEKEHFMLLEDVQENLNVKNVMQKSIITNGMATNKQKKKQINKGDKNVIVRFMSLLLDNSSIPKRITKLKEYKNC